VSLRRAALLIATGLFGFCSAAFAAADGSKLELPTGATIAIVVFEDLQCPDCARAHPAVLAAAAASKVPLVIHDYPIPRHAWAFPAAVLARYFASQSPALGLEFRGFIFLNQPGIDADNLRPMGEKFARAHQLQLPADVDPEGKLQAGVQADYDLGTEIHLDHVPLIFVIGPGEGASRFVEVPDPGQLADVISQMRNRLPSP
jgi:protein-disulfide isomerase